MKKNFKNWQMRSSLLRKFNSERGSIELLFLILPTFISFMGMVMLIKGFQSVEKIKLTAQLYLCAKNYNERTVEHFQSQTKLNQKIATLQTALLIDVIPKAAALRRAAIKALKIKQEINFKIYQKHMLKNSHCSHLTKAQILLKYPFKNKGLILTRKLGLLQLRKKQWKINISSKSLKKLNLYLEGRWQVDSKFKTSGSYSYLRKEIPLLSSFLGQQ